MKNKVEHIYPANSLQQGFIYHAVSFPEDDAYRVQLLLDYHEAIDTEKYLKAWEYCIATYPILRTAFNWKEELIQVVYKYGKLDYKIHDISHLDTQQQKDEAIQAIQHDDRTEGFDLTKPTLLRLHIIKQSPDQYTVLKTEHHSIMDGWSGPVLLKCLHNYYEDLKNDKTVVVKEDTAYLKAQEYIYRYKESIQPYWNDKRSQIEAINDINPLLSKPVNLNNYKQVGRSATKGLTINGTFYNAIKKFSKEHGITINVMIQFTWHKLLQVYSSNLQSIVGTTISGRDLPIEGIEESVGLYINTLPLVIEWGNKNTIQEQLQEIQNKITELNTHSFADLAKLQNAGERLFHSLLIYENYPASEKEETEARMSIRDAIEKMDYPLTVLAYEYGDTLAINLKYDADCLDEEKVNRHLKMLEHLLYTVIQTPDKLHSEISLLNKEEYQQIVYDWNATEKELLLNKTICSLIEEQVKEQPDKVALVFEEKKLSYKELDDKSNQLAHFILEQYKERLNKPFACDTLIAICVERGLEMVIAMLAVLKAGGAYVPVDPSYPQERIDYMLMDTKAELILTQRHTRHKTQLPNDKILYINLTEEFYVKQTSGKLPAICDVTNLAYVIYTSGTTGKPKGVMITHQGLFNFLQGMKDIIPLTEQDHFLAVTSISFDIAVLELLWCLTIGTTITIKPDNTHHHLDSFLSNYKEELDFSLFYFSSKDGLQNNTYEFFLDSVKYADENKFSAVWIPERHFHEFGGIFPNPSVLAAGVATITKNIEIRSGSVVLPLHDVIRVAEEWSVVDNLSNGRTAISLASGWHPDDFVLKPENYQERHSLMYRQIEDLKKLWQGESLKRINGVNDEIKIKIFPKPVNPDLKIYITSAGSSETFVSAGKMGANILTHLLGQEISDLEKNIKLYKQALRDNGFSVEDAKIALMLHTYIGTDLEEVKRKVKDPFKLYLKSSVSLISKLSKEFNMSDTNINDSDLDYLLDIGFERYWQTSALLGTPESCKKILSSIYAIGVTEVACLIDFGMEDTDVMQGLKQLNQLKNKYVKNKTQSGSNAGNITAMQLTPTYLSALLEDEYSAAFIKSLKHILVGGERFPSELLKKLRTSTKASIYNMYGPTETTIWSTFEKASGKSHLDIGKPIQNTRVYILSENHQPLPIGVTGELYIGGAGLSRGYLNLPDLTKEKFIKNPFATTADIASGYTRLYRTGDMVRWLGDGTIEYIGRNDDQVKIRGHRIELKEIEHVLEKIDGIEQACVVIKERNVTKENVKYLAAYYVNSAGPLNQDWILDSLTQTLPDYMIPSSVTHLKEFPLSVNGKLDKRSLPEPDFNRSISTYVQPTTEMEIKLCASWQELLRLERVGITDDFFRIGGDSISAIQLSFRMSKLLEFDITVADVFKLKTIKGILEHVYQTQEIYDNVDWSLH